MRGRASLLLASAVGVSLACGSSAPHEPRGERAATAQLLDHSGAAYELSSAWKDRYAVVVFYRGHW